MMSKEESDSLKKVTYDGGIVLCLTAAIFMAGNPKMNNEEAMDKAEALYTEAAVRSKKRQQEYLESQR